MTYTVPGEALALMPFQVDGVKFLQEAGRRCAGLFDDMGLGKTPQVLKALRGEPTLVACPSVVKDNWAHEVRRWRPEYRTSIQKSRRSFRWPRPGEIRITTYDLLPPSLKEIKELRDQYVPTMPIADARALRNTVLSLERQRKRLLTKPWPGTRLVADEAQYIKTPEAIRTRRWRELAALAYDSGGGIWVVTGTPLENRYDELWYVLQGAGLGSLIFGTRERYRMACDDKSAPKKIQQHTIRRMKSDVLPQLPHKRRETRLVALDRGAKAAADALVLALRERGIKIEQATLEQIQQAREDTALNQHIMVVRASIAKAKIPYALDFVLDQESKGVPLVVFSDHRAPIDLMSQRRGWAAITGDEDAKTKFRNAQRFQAGRLRGIACTIRAAGTGINLDRASRALFVDLTWTPAKIDQAEDRLLRATQRARSVEYYRLVADHELERRIDYLLRIKQERIDNVVNASSIPGRGGSL